eukprot:XP_011428332.1 PREDICTED: uncharacterized protein LOC105328955 [Crassostrea gigas]
MENRLFGKLSCLPLKTCFTSNIGCYPGLAVKKTDNTRDSNRVTFLKRVHKVEPVFLEHSGTFLQRSYVSFLSTSSEEDEGTALNNFVEKFITDTVRAAVDKYIMDTWKEVRQGSSDVGDKGSQLQTMTPRERNAD